MNRFTLGCGRHIVVGLFAAFSLAGCAGLVPAIDPPKVSVDSVQSLPMVDSGPRFRIVLRVANPNAQALDIAGVSYVIALMDRELVSGVTNQVPTIEGYTEEQVTIDAGVNLIEALKLLGTLGRSRGDPLEYRVTAKIDFRGLIPTQYVEDSGTLRLN
ncbi:MAG: LEA type 2 family protein [Haliea sp.]|jgi:LEA14-like dessication related protein|nr:LEA type 2 family protein [Haliea sp.]